MRGIIITNITTWTSLPYITTHINYLTVAIHQRTIWCVVGYMQALSNFNYTGGIKILIPVQYSGRNQCIFSLVKYYIQAYLMTMAKNWFHHYHIKLWLRTYSAKACNIVNNLAFCPFSEFIKKMYLPGILNQLAIWQFHWNLTDEILILMHGWRRNTLKYKWFKKMLCTGFFSFFT